MVIKYDYNFILKLKNCYFNNQSKIDDLKKHAVQLININKKQIQLNIKYQSNKWRYNDKEELFKKKLNGVLNKISLDNYEELQNIIKNIGNSINLENYNDLDYLVESIINKSLCDIFYIHIYGKLLKDMCKYKWYCRNISDNTTNTYISFFELLLIKVQKLYEQIYDGIITDKTKCISIVTLINQLFLNNILSSHIYLSTIFGLLYNPSELNIELVCKMINVTYDFIPSNYLDNILDKLNCIHSTTKNTRLKYMLLDILEKNQKKEIVIESDEDDKFLNILDEYIMNENIEDIIYIVDEYKNDKLIKFIDCLIMYSFNYNEEKNKKLMDLSKAIIVKNKLNIISVIQNLVNRIEDIMIDYPKGNSVLLNYIIFFIKNHFITNNQYNKLFDNTTDSIKKLMNFEDKKFKTYRKN